MIENLNRMTRQELSDTQRFMTGEAFQSLSGLLKSEPDMSGFQASHDQFIVDFSFDIIEDINCSLEPGDLGHGPGLRQQS